MEQEPIVVGKREMSSSSLVMGQRVRTSQKLISSERLMGLEFPLKNACSAGQNL